jgi:hypothetical protein
MDMLFVPRQGYWWGLDDDIEMRQYTQNEWEKRHFGGKMLLDLAIPLHTEH